MPLSTFILIRNESTDACNFIMCFVNWLYSYDLYRYKIVTYNQCAKYQRRNGEAAIEVGASLKGEKIENFLHLR